jgi:hypothetical protein
MAKTIARAWGHDSSRVKETHRLGSVQAETLAATYRTFAHAHVRADGAVYIQVTRDGKEIHAWECEAEPSPEPSDTIPNLEAV